MKNLKNKQCLIPKCHKEVYKLGAKFCLEHKRVAVELPKTAGKALGTVLTVGVAIVGIIKIKDEL